ncbi:MAG: ATP-binding cassette domain-containing protein [Acidimicrobiia bacterium]|nr:ATP-binding cassette domain-containing protein [Acidimicrobiia bacterium]
MSAITTHDLSRSFDGEPAVVSVDLAVADGEVYGFLGPNGAGKSTTVRMLCTLLRPSGGHAKVAGLDVVDQAAAVRLRIGVALQEAALDEKQTGREILRMQGRLYGMTGSTLDKRIDEVLRFVEIGDAIDRRVGTYSGGMKRRVDLASALLHEPEVLFLDEPTTGLDPVSRSKVWDEVRRLNTDLGVTIFLTTQYLEEADVLADRVGIIDAGQIVAEGTPEALKRSVGSDVIVATIDETDGQDDSLVAALSALSGVTDVNLRDGELVVSAANGASVVNDLVVALNGAGRRAEALTLRTPTLDDVFLNATGHRIRTGAGLEGTDEVDGDSGHGSHGSEEQR